MLKFTKKTPGHDKSESLPLNEESSLTDEERIKNYLDSLGCVLWGRFFDIQTKEDYREAQEFILDLLIDLGYTRKNVE